MINGIPVIRLEIEQMKHSILSHLHSYNEDIEKVVAEEIDKAVANVDLREEVRKHIAEGISESIEAYLKYGEGRLAIKTAVFESLTGKN